MNIIAKSIRSIALTGLMVAALPLAASALTVGVSNEIDTSIVTGKLCQTSSSSQASNGTEWTTASSSKTENGIATGSTVATAGNPASSNSTTNGHYTATAASDSGSQGTYNNLSQSSSQLIDGQESQTSIVHTISAFTNP